MDIKIVLARSSIMLKFRKIRKKSEIIIFTRLLIQLPCIILIMTLIY
ncbi:hypothetical protein RT0796 [Rickettsia typhi str. Wilmington]|uniref:Uncharacterized protein n=1 Tax=Rickettsia typhi (strain ATCC VR-144 / Wilmington) TaxID=257363 RepID=Q68VU0_RICTY|nr:hypothetical protein RT0796 [Rickettsia typhi str. Wilmington]